MKEIPGYGRSPLHLLGVVFCYGLAAYAGARLLSEDAFLIILAFVGGIVVHDFVLSPLHSKADSALESLQDPQKQKHTAAGPWINYVRWPMMVSGLLLLLYFPIILQFADERPLYTAMRLDPYLYRWLGVTAALFAGSALSYFLRKKRAKQQPAHPESQD